MSISWNVGYKMASCKNCAGKCYYKTEDGKSKRCKPCFEYDLFLHYMKLGNVDESFIDVSYAKDLRQAFYRNKTVVVETLNSEEQRKWANSGAYMGCRYLKRSQIFYDFDIINSVLDGASIEEGSSSLQRFLEPKFAAFFLGKTRNKNFIGSHILQTFWQREAQDKLTLIIIPGSTRIKDLYDYEDLTNFIESIKKDRQNAYLHRFKFQNGNS